MGAFTIFKKPDAKQIICFNPCFLGMGAFTRRKSHLRINWKNVSILVFLEWALSLQLPTTIWALLICFNPCFLGMGAFTIFKKPDAKQIICFNPCFLGMGAFTCFVSPVLLANWMFQSLFSWNGRFHHLQPYAESPFSDWVSILVFLEWALSLVISSGQKCLTIIMFQSLFSWNGRFHKAKKSS